VWAMEVRDGGGGDFVYGCEGWWVTMAEVWLRCVLSWGSTMMLVGQSSYASCHPGATNCPKLFRLAAAA
jgi:hypothetical protein